MIYMYFYIFSQNFEQFKQKKNLQKEKTDEKINFLINKM